MNKTLKSRIEQRLQELGKTPRGASIEATGSPDTIRTILSGRIQNPRSDTLARIADVLQTTPEWLMGRSSNKDGRSVATDAERLFEIASTTVDAWLAKTGLTVSLEARNRMIIAESQRLIDLGDAVSKVETAEEDAE